MQIQSFNHLLFMKTELKNDFAVYCQREGFKHVVFDLMNSTSGELRVRVDRQRPRNLKY